MVESGRYFEANGQAERAVQLYIKGGDLASGLDLCLRVLEGDPASSTPPTTTSKRTREALLDFVQEIADQLSEASSPETVRRCADFLYKSWRDHAKAKAAIRLFGMLLSPPSIASRTDAAATATVVRRLLRLCLEHEVPITEAMADNMLAVACTPRGLPAEGKVDEEDHAASQQQQQQQLAVSIATACRRQNSHALASKAFTRAGDVAQALECLLQAGDAQHIIQYASATQRPDLCLTAANHLQEGGQWRHDDAVRAGVANLYARAKAGEAQRHFQVECDRARMIMKQV